MPNPPQAATRSFERFGALAAVALVAIVVGGALHLAGEPTAGDAIWAGLTAAMLVPLTWSVARDARARALRRRRDRADLRWRARSRSASTSRARSSR